MQIKRIIEMLNADEWMVNDYDIQFAKGLKEAPAKLKELRPYLKRNLFYHGK